MNLSQRIAIGLVVASAGLAGCESKSTVDLGTTAPASRGVASVIVDLQGVEFRKGDGGSERLEFRDPTTVDLTDYSQGNLFRLFTDEQLADGSYTGARLIIAADEDEDDRVELADGRPFDLLLGSTTTFSEVSFTVDKDDSSETRIVLNLDLRQSLAFNDDNDTYTLTPVLRAVRDGDIGELTGSVNANCAPGGTLIEGGAAYVFAGRDVTPDDRDGTEPEPYLTTPIDIQANTGQTYSFSFLPEGDYTLSLTCNGDEEDGATNDNDDMTFQNTVNVSIEAEQRTTQDFR